MLKKITPGILALCLCLIITACSSPSSPQVIQATPVTNARNDKAVEIRNCDGKEDLHRPLTEEKTLISHVEIASEAVVVASGKTVPLPDELKTSLEEQVRQTYQSVLEEERAIVEQTDLVVPPGKIRNFKIFSNEKTFSSKISLRMNFQACEVAYTYRLDVPYINEYWDLNCTA